MSNFLVVILETHALVKVSGMPGISKAVKGCQGLYCILNVSLQPSRKVTDGRGFSLINIYSPSIYKYDKPQGRYLKITWNNGMAVNSLAGMFLDIFKNLRIKQELTSTYKD